MIKSPKAVLLDFYGTLVLEDSGPIFDICSEIARTASKPTSPDHVFADWSRIFHDLCLNSYGDKFELERELERAAGHITVDALAEGFDDVQGLRLESKDELPGRPLDAQRPHEPVHVEALRAYDLGEPAFRESEHELYLDQAVLRHHEAQRPEAVEVAPGEDVRDAGPVVDDLHRGIEAVEPKSSRGAGFRQVEPGREISRCAPERPAGAQCKPSCQLPGTGQAACSSPGVRWNQR